jgi:Tol biopolymer transport system component
MCHRDVGATERPSARGGWSGADRRRWRSPSHLAILLLVVVPGITLTAQPPVNSTERVSVASDGNQGNDDSGGSPERDVAISADGRYVAFTSRASNLVVGDTNGQGDVFVHDRTTGATTRVSVATDGTQATRYSRYPAISADGRYVAFVSDANDLVANDTNQSDDVFVHDCVTNTTTRESVANGGMQGNAGSAEVSMSADGRYLAFTSWATNLVPGDTNGRPDAFVRDRLAGVTTRVSVATSGAQANGDSDSPAISADGRYVAFASGATNLVSGDTNGLGDVFVHDRVTGATTRVSVASDGTQGNWSSGFPAVSGDGRVVAFESEATNLVAGDTNGSYDIFAHDRTTGVTTRVSVATDRTQANWSSFYPTVTPDGWLVAFMSESSNLVAGDTNGRVDVFLHDLVAGTTTRVSVATDGTQANDDSYWPAVTPDGRMVAFGSGATNLVPVDTNQRWDVFVRDRGRPLAPPTGLAAGAAGSVVTMAWTPPGGTPPATGYLIEAGSAPGLRDLAAIATGHALPTFAASGVAAGTYFLRVRAMNGEWLSTPSNDVSLQVGGGSPGGPGAPGGPQGLTATARGSTVTLSWTAPATGGTPSSYVVEAGSAPGLVDLARIATGNPTTAFVATGVWNRQYVVRVRAANAWGTSAPSNEVSVEVALEAPGLPSGLSGSSTGSSLSIRWMAPSTGGEVSAYMIEAGSAPGLSDVAVFSTGSPGPGYTAWGVPDGTYFVRIRATNAAGVSAPSNEAVLVVGCTGAPGPPGVFHGEVLQWGLVHLVWTPPVLPPMSSNGHTGYVVEAGSAPGLSNLGMFLVDPHQTFVHFLGVRDGVYYVRVKATNACGSGAPSNELRVVMQSHRPQPAPPAPIRDRARLGGPTSENPSHGLTPSAAVRSSTRH